MKKRVPKQQESAGLRRKAEEVLRADKKGDLDRPSSEDAASLIHELQVHQVELEMQNHELREALIRLEESRSKYSDLYDFAPISYFSLDINGLIHEVNLTGAALLQVERISLINMPFSRFVHKDDKNSFYAYHKSILKTLSAHHVDVRLLKKDGSIISALLECRPVQDNKGGIILLRTAVMDITELKQAEKALELKTHDLGKRIRELNCLFESSKIMTESGISEDAAYHKILQLIPLSLKHPETASGRITVYDRQYNTVNFKETGCKHSAQIMVSGELAGSIDVYYQLEKLPLHEGRFLKEEKRLINGLSRAIGNFLERKRLEAGLQEAAITDGLTGLLNRRGFFTLSEQQCKLSDRTGRQLSLLYLDLDDMKKINDELGHKTGDQALVDIADILKRTLRESDIIARIGGDEFAVLLTEHADGLNNIILPHLLNNVRMQNEKAGRRYKLSLSIGVSHYNPAHACSVEDLLTAADRSMYEVKKRQKSTGPLKPAFKESRAYTRFTAEDMCTANLSASSETRVRNISLGGMCLKTSHRLIPGKEHVLTAITCGRIKAEAKGAVVWSSPLQAAARPGNISYACEAGLKFSGLTADEERALESIISHLTPD